MILASRLYAIMDAALLRNGSRRFFSPASRGAVETAARLLDAGVRILQYRNKGPFTRQAWSDCVAIAGLAAASGAQFYVNDRADIALLCRAAGVHLGQQDLPPAQARKIVGDRARIGFSTHSLEQAREAQALPVDYVAIGPVFRTSTKENPDPVVGLETVSAVRAAVRKPIVAIGGITLENAREVIDAGADAVAVVRDLLLAPDLAARARQFLERLETPRGVLPREDA